MRFDVAIIGGGIVGLATAYRLLQRRPGMAIALLEKETALARHQSGHNSGVLHSGIYYRPGSVKARTCRTGKQQMEEFCRQEDIPFEICGKVIVAVTELERNRLQTLLERGEQNGVCCRWIDADRLKELEPHCRGIAGIHVTETGIVDYRDVCAALARRITASGAQVLLGREVRDMRQGSDRVTLATDGSTLSAGTVINCAGLFSDRVARKAGSQPSARILPFRGEYYRLRPAARHFCRHLIYPVPDPRFPFLGVHFTREMSGEVECGPNAVLAMSREGYRRRDFKLGDVVETLSYRGFWRMAARYGAVGWSEWWRSVSKQAFLQSLRRLVPALQASDLMTGPTGVRAQAVLPDGHFVDDFVIEREGRMVHVCNAPSPAATASLKIGEVIADQVL